jgi:uncharacterized protein (TIGR02145 family)
MVLRFFLLAVTFLFISCADFERDNPEDQRSNKYGASQLQSSPSGEPSSNSTPGTSSVGGGASSSSSSKPSSSSVAPVQTGIIKGDPVTYENETYETVVIGTQTWMAKNLNYDVEGTKCLQNDDDNCAIYGKLYNWATAMALPDSCNTKSCASQISDKHRGICPPDYHIPSDAEWGTLMQFLNPSCSPTKDCSVGNFLKATSEWKSGNGTDDFGFAALPGGAANAAGTFLITGNYAFWWSTYEIDSGNAYNRGMYTDAKVSHNSSDKYGLDSVRCLQD